MSILLNETDIKNLSFNGTDLKKLIINNIEVWTGSVYETVKNYVGEIPENLWLQFVEEDDIALARSKEETSSFIGKNVILSNSVAPNYTSWQIADFNHDSSGDTVDLIQNNTVYSSSYGSSRNWLNNTYLSGFSDRIKNLLVLMLAKTSTGDTEDKIKILSGKEVGASYQSIPTTEGSKYPIFTSTSDLSSNPSRIRSGTANSWWLRSRNTNNANYNWVVGSSGNLGTSQRTGGPYGLLPCIRFKHTVIPSIYYTVKNATDNITEAELLEFLNSGCVSIARNRFEESSFIGKNVTISNTGIPNYTSWKIADFNHDGSGNTIDLIQNNTISEQYYNYSSQATYQNSGIRSWLIDSYLTWFSNDIKQKLQTMTVTTSDGTTSDKIKILSGNEVGASHSSMAAYEGSKYPIFTSTSGIDTDSSRVRSGASSEWWIRSRQSTNADYTWRVTETGALGSKKYNTKSGILPCIRLA